LSGGRLFDPDAEAIWSGMALDDFADREAATADDAFKPKCLGIYPSAYV
jgi:hypothetical protein